MPDKAQSIVVYLGLGSNLGDRGKNLDDAIDLIGHRLKVVRRSPVYQTEPFAVPDQPKFLNMVIEARTHLKPEDLLQFLKSVEKDMGRGSAGSTEPRLIDIDILFYGKMVMATDDLTIPHPHLPQRAFVLAPLNDLAPNLMHPITKKTVAEMLSALDTTPGVEKLPETKDSKVTKRGTAMYYVTVENHFDAAHFLRGYQGKCENLHGHRYKIAVKLSSAGLNEIGLAYDFGDLKGFLKPIVARYDHVLLNDVPPFDKINPSAENIARVVYEEIKARIKGVDLESVTVWESPESSAEYREI